MLVIQRVVVCSARQMELEAEVRAALARARRARLRMPRRVNALIVAGSDGEGGEGSGEYFITVPVSAFKKPASLRWFVGHELAHVGQAYSGEYEGQLPHDEEFYRRFLTLCDPTAQYREHAYRPQAAKRFGVPRGPRRSGGKA